MRRVAFFQLKPLRTYSPYANAQWIRLYGRAAKNTNNGHNVLKFITII